MKNKVIELACKFLQLLAWNSILIGYAVFSIIVMPFMVFEFFRKNIK